MSELPCTHPARALILAAGRGERMRPLTDHTPKPLLEVRGQPLMQWWLDALARGGVRSVVINTAWLGHQIEGHFDRQRLIDKREQLSNDDRLSIHFSAEGRDFGHALETLGGIVRALPLLSSRPDEVFWVMAGDIFAPEFSISADAAQRFVASGHLAHLWLVPNPAHNPKGDFGLSAHGMALNDAAPGGVRYTFSTVALYRRALFEPPWCDIPVGNPQGEAAPLAPLLRRAIEAGKVGASLYTGSWTDVGTPERLAQLNGVPAPSHPGRS